VYPADVTLTVSLRGVRLTAPQPYKPMAADGGRVNIRAFKDMRERVGSWGVDFG
jgi:hypothetical protein